VRLPSTAKPLEQDEEWCELEEQGEWHRLRFHSYAEIFSQPGLYEHLFYGLLKCCSPERVGSMLETCLQESGGSPGEHRVFDLGAGNGMLGEELKRRGFTSMLGVDLLPEAKAATERDRPRVYDDYVVADLVRFDAETRARIEAFKPTCLCCVAALGFGDIPPRAWFNAMSTIPAGGLLAFNIRADFLDARYAFGFSELVRRMTGENVIRIEAMQRYKHRLSVRGEPLWYTAIVATKLEDVPQSMLVDP
jgi:predicted TPR repeat methyltransferase